MRLGIIWSLSLLPLSFPLAFASEVTEVLRYASSSPEMRQFVSEWRSRGEQLLPLLSASDVQQRRAAALILGELGDESGVTAAALLTALSRQQDVETTRWATRSLIGRLNGIPAESILALRENVSVITLLTDHPSQGIMDDAAVIRYVTPLLVQEAWCEMAIMLVVARGTVATYGPVLMSALTTTAKTKSPTQATIIQVLHQGLSLLTKRQRGLAAYAGHYDLLVKDWTDELAAQKPIRAQKNDPRVAALIGRLPEKAALMELLPLGAPALAEVEQAMVGASKEGRRDLDHAARLLARSVSPIIYLTLGDDGLRDLDSERVAERLALLKRITEVVSEKHDAAGVQHLLAWCDDPDAIVRAAALDRLVRLSDSKKEFNKQWTITDGGLFPPSSSRYRLRRAITKGTPDEQIAALLLAASLSANDLSDDVAGLLFSSSTIVAQTAIETLGHLNASVHSEALMRFAVDEQQALPLRLKALELLAKSGSSSSNNQDQIKKQALISTLNKAANTHDRTLRAAILKAQFALQKDDKETRNILVTLLAGSIEDQRIGLGLIASRPVSEASSNANNGAFAPILFVDLALPFIQHEEADMVEAAVVALVAGLQNTKARTAVLALFTDSIQLQLKARIARMTQPTPVVLTLGLATAVIPRSEALHYFKKIPKDDWYQPWREYLYGFSDLTEAIDLALAVQRANEPLDDYVIEQLLDRLLAEALLAPELLKAVLAVGDFNVLSHDDDTEYGNNKRTTTIQLSQKRVLVVVGKQQGSNGFSSSDRYEWTLTGAAPVGPSPMQLRTWSDRLLLLTTKKKQAKRDLIVALLREELPSNDIVIEVENDLALWRIAMARYGGLRERVVAAINASTTFSSYRLAEVVELGNADLIPALIRALVTADDDYDVRRFASYLASLPAKTFEPHFAELLKNQFVANNQVVQDILRAVGKIPLAGAIQILQQGGSVPGQVMPYDEAEMIRQTRLFTALEPAHILGGITILRAIRDAAPTIFDVMMKGEASRQDAVGAAWLRTGIPMQAGMRLLYVQALNARQADVWLVGAAIGLKEDRLTPAAFFEKLPTLPDATLLDAAAVASRYLKGKMNEQGEALAGIITRSSPEILAVWLPIMPPLDHVTRALGERVREPVLADQIGLVLTACLRVNRDDWMNVIKIIAPNANGKLDYLLPNK
jgi:hypothetical protein